jgi:hypothetical protein
LPLKVETAIAAMMFCAAALTAAAQGGEAGGRSREAERALEKVWEPRIVAVPPAAAVRDMCVTAGGQIRHYGFIADGQTKKRVYAASDDCGMSWRTVPADPADAGAMVRSPWSGEWIYFTGREPVTLVRSKTGPGDTAATVTPMPWKHLELRQLTPLKSRKRWLAAFSDVTCENGECYHAVTAYSDDDGRTWVRSDLSPVADVERMSAGDRRPHWFNDGCEPSFVELKDGSILLCVRTSGPHAAFYRSADGGETWGAGKPDEAFWQSNTMPYFLRLKDGRILFFWNNTASLPTRALPEYPELSPGERSGRWESVFTNRDALHAAISDDEGKTWRGFREVALNEIRNAADFRELGNGPFDEHDKSVHQTQALELPGGKVLLAYGQNPSARRILIFDPDWLTETARSDDFRHGLGNLSTHLYVKSCTGGWRGWAGHCAWNRVPGALLVRDPHMDSLSPGAKPSNRDVLQLCRIRDGRLVCDRQGVVWNFPASRSGRLELDCRIIGSGFKLTLADHWMNPSDETGPGRCPFSERIDDGTLRVPGWHRVSVEWSGAKVRISADGVELVARDGVRIPRFGFSYVHLQTLAEETDEKGTCFRSFDFAAKPE